MKRTVKGWKRPESELVRVEIELPYYWAHDLTGDDAQHSTILYGRLNPDLSEDEIMCRGKRKFEICVRDPLPEGKPWEGMCYLQDKYKTHAWAFGNALRQLKDAVKEIEDRK